MPTRTQVTLQLSQILLQPGPLAAKLDRFLQVLMEVPELSLQAKGAIFLKREESLRLVAEHRLYGPLKTLCAQLPLGRCLCGRVGLTGEALWSPQVDEAHEIRYPGMLPHGHAILPLKVDGRVLGVLNLYLEPGARLSPEAMDILETAAGLLALAVLRERAERAASTLHRANLLALEAQDETEYLKRLSALVVEEGYALAWIGEALPDGRVRPIEGAGAVGYLEGLVVRHDETPEGQGPTGRAIRLGKPQVLRDVDQDPNCGSWRERAKSFGFASSAAFPIRIGGRVFGSLNVYAPEPDAFDQEEVALLQDLADLAGKTLERLRAEAQARYLRYHDPLTGLPNRAFLEEEWRGGEEAYSLVLADLDRFGEINQTHGRKVGDALLAALAREGQKILPKGGKLYRLGDDEFLFLLPGEPGQVPGFYKGLREAAKASAQEVLGSGTLGVSVGVVVYPVDGRDLGELLRRADLALRQAKKEQGLAFFNPELETRYRERRSLLAALEEALQGGRLVLFGQPIVDLSTLKPVATEVLLRWPKDGGFVPAEAFIPLAEETGLIRELGLYVLRLVEALPDGHVWHVNISPQTLRDPRFLEAASRLRGKGVEFEITEYALAQGVEEVLRALKGMGFGLVLDDFGQGYASLNTLLQHSFDMVKVDRVFVAGLGENPKSHAVLRASLNLAQELGMKVVAEGVETEEQRAWLLRLGYRLAQGYLFGPPGPSTGPKPVL